MHITRYSDYALRVLLFLAAQPDRLATIQQVADRYDISRSHLMKVVNQLNQRGYVNAVRGKNGGMKLGRPPSEINIGTLFRITESDMKLVECFSAEGACVISPVCRLKGVFAEARTAFLRVLDWYTLADLTAGTARDELRQVLELE